MRNVIGILLMVAGVAVAVYVGLWVCFIGGIVQCIEAVKATPVDAWGIAFGVVRIVFAGFAGVITAFFAIIPGFAMLKA